MQAFKSILWILLFSPLLSTDLLAQRNRGRDANFLRTINQGRLLDPYNPRVYAGMYVLGLENRSENDGITSRGSTAFFRYYHDTKLRFHLEHNSSDKWRIGSEYKIEPLLGDSDWIGLNLNPDNDFIDLYGRGILNLSRHSKLQYLGELSTDGDRIIFGGRGGYYSQPFRKSKNTYVQALSSYHILSDEYFAATAFTIGGEIGHVIANLLQVEGLQIHSALGLEMTQLATTVDLPSGERVNDSKNDIDFSFTIGILKHGGF